MKYKINNRAITGDSSGGGNIIEYTYFSILFGEEITVKLLVPDSNYTPLTIPINMDGEDYMLDIVDLFAMASMCAEEDALIKEFENIVNISDIETIMKIYENSILEIIDGLPNTISISKYKHFQGSTLYIDITLKSSSGATSTLSYDSMFNKTLKISEMRLSNLVKTKLKLYCMQGAVLPTNKNISYGKNVSYQFYCYGNQKPGVNISDVIVLKQISNGYTVCNDIINIFMNSYDEMTATFSDEMVGKVIQNNYLIFSITP